MNNYTRSIASIMRYNIYVRDTLEYALQKQQFEQNIYRAKKSFLLAELEQNTPLKVCLDNSGEAGSKLMQQLHDLIDAIYGDQSTIVRVTESGLHVDFAQRLTVMKLVMPVHEEIQKVITAHTNGAKKNNQFNDKELEDLLYNDELYYRGFCFLLLLDELDLLFVEYNHARQEAKGGYTPQSNFIQNDINELVKLINMTRSNSSITSADYYEIVDPLFALIEMTNGRRDLPSGKNFGTVFTETKKIIKEHVTRWENTWRMTFDPFVKRFIEDAKKFQEEQKANKEAAEKAKDNIGIA